MSQRVLQARERLQVRAVALAGLGRREEFARVAKLLRGDPHRVPLLGSLFKSKDTEQSNNELLIFITPRIISNNLDLSQ